MTVFENTDTINEPVIALPIVGKISFRQIGIIIGLAIILPMAIYSGGSTYILNVFPDPAFSFDTVNIGVKITWDILFAIIPVPVGLVFGVPRPKLLPMDKLIVILIEFMICHTSVKSIKAKKKTMPKHTSKKSAFVGFVRKDEIVAPKKKALNIYPIAVTDLGVPKNITITLYDQNGNPMRNKLARAYIDEDLLCSITTDSDGMIGMTFVPKSEGIKHLKILVDGVSEPVVDTSLDVKRQD